MTASKDAGLLVQASLSGAMGRMGKREIAMQMLAPKRSRGREFNGTQKGFLTKGHEVFNELCLTCHNPDGRGTPIEGKPGATQAPPLAGAPTVTGPKEAFIAVLLKGLAGPSTTNPTTRRWSRWRATTITGLPPSPPT